ncbi:YbaK family protein [Bacillus shivajii]|uniref:DUF2521 family protein n=1 Tax=Bacillus shivajii TaxID=1983719 RepID=UPI001CFB0670|nr:DUF2521 family protein [Bacillus shivajii]UCZ53408.1 YbaK family protein [Bacillus shivajii]
MNVITSLGEKRRKKQWKFERSILRSLSIQTMKTDVFQTFFSQQFGESVGKLYLTDFCLDIGIDAYLLGSEFSRFGYYGDPPKKVKVRCQDELDAYIQQCVSQFQAWFHLDDNESDKVKEKCTAFLDKWWTTGFKEGEKRHRLRLH